VPALPFERARTWVESCFEHPSPEVRREGWSYWRQNGGPGFEPSSGGVEVARGETNRRPVSLETRVPANAGTCSKCKMDRVRVRTCPSCLQIYCDDCFFSWGEPAAWRPHRWGCAARCATDDA
jgi:hypothetical protein